MVFYPLYFVFCTILFAYCTFPYDRLRDRIEQEVERSIPGADLEIVSLSPSWFTGVELEGVSLTLRSETPEERAASLTFTELRVRFGVFDAFGGTVSVSFFGELGGGGTIEGKFVDSETKTQLRAHLDGIALGRIGPLRRLLQLPIAGTLSGDIDVTLAQEVVETQGEVALQVADLAIGDGRARLQLPGMPSGVTVERLEAGDLVLRMHIERGVGRIEQLASSGEDLEFRGAGAVRLLRPLRLSMLDNLLLRIDVKQRYRERNDRTRAIFAILDMSPEVRAFRAPDGAYQVRLAGSLGTRIRAEPAGNATLPH
jgi:type II secretion system protein N